VVVIGAHKVMDRNVVTLGARKVAALNGVVLVARKVMDRNVVTLVARNIAALNGAARVGVRG
jgi:hypothetical protein